MAESKLATLADELTELARVLGPEDEGIDLSDHDFEMEDLVALRSLLSQRRRAIDVVNKALADYWSDVYGKARLTQEHSTWGLTRSKGKKLINADLFFNWLSRQTPEKLKSLVSASSIKVTGFTSEERSTFLDESPTNDRLSIESRPRA